MNCDIPDEPTNLINFDQANSEMVIQQIDEMEEQVREMERSLLVCASQLHDSIKEKIDAVSFTGEVIEFNLPEGEGIIELSEYDGSMPNTSGPADFESTIDAAREQLEILNETISNLELPN